MDFQSFQPNPPTPQVPQQTPPVKKTFTLKFIALVVGLLVLGGVVSVGLWFWNDKNKEAVAPTFTPRVIDETASWKTYRNDQYGFEVKYPADYRETGISSEGTSINTQIGFISSDTDTSKDYPFIILALPNDQSLDSRNPNAKTLADYEKNYTSSGRNITIEKNEYKSADVLKQSYSVSGGLGSEGRATRYIFFKDGRFYILVHWSGGYKNGDSLLLDKMAATFKFIDSADTSTWKTYQNNKYRYSIQYPANWSVDTQNAYDDMGFGGFTYTLEGPIAISGNFSSGGTLFLRLNDNPDERGRDTLTFQIVKPDPAIRIEDFTPHEASLFDASDKKETLTISGLPAVRYTDSKYVAGKDINYSFGTTFIKDNKNGVVYLFTYFRPDLAPIISTFKLLKPGDDFMCVQVITRAKDPKSGREIDFPTPCDVPEGWVQI